MSGDKKLFISLIFFGVLIAILTLLMPQDDFVYYGVLLAIIIVIAKIISSFFFETIQNLIGKIEKINIRLDKKVEQRTAELHQLLGVIDKYVIRSETDLNGKILNVSEAFCAISGYSKEELIGESHALIRHSDMEKELFTEMWNTIHSGKIWTGILKNRDKSGNSYWVESKIEPNFINGEIVSFTSIRNDITLKVQLEELNSLLTTKIAYEVEKSRKQLEEIQKEQIKNVKLSSIGALAAGITHEINTPLTYMKGNFELMQYDLVNLPASDTKTRMLEDSAIIAEGIQRISTIIEAMKEVSQKSREAVEEVNLYQTLITSLIVGYNRSKHVCKIYINNRLFTPECNKTTLEFYAMLQKQRVEQVWIIIMNNAFDALNTICDYESRRLDIEIMEKDNSIIIHFKDNAGGIDPCILDNIFEPFTSTKESGGMGIGLNIAKKIVEENNGKITVCNENNGAKFTIEFQGIKEKV